MGPADDELARQLADANRILHSEGVLDAFGHISARSVERPDRFLLSRNKAPALVQPDDIQTVTLDGQAEDDRPSYLERFIHSAVYSARPDVQAVVHSHATSVIPFTVAREPLRPVMHIAGFLAEGVGRFDLRDIRGDGTDLLIADQESGLALADSLGEGRVVLMRGHGYVTAAESVPLAVYQAVYTRVAAQTQLDALALGEPEYLTAAEGRAAAESNAKQVGRAWAHWLRGIRPDPGS